MFIHFFCFLFYDTATQITKISEKEKAWIALISALFTTNRILMQMQGFMNIVYSKQREAFIVLINQVLMERNTSYY